MKLSNTQKRRLAWVLALLLGAAVTISLILFALSENLNLFFSPSDVAKNQAVHGEVIRIGGLVMPGTVKRSETNLDVRFKITDNAHHVDVLYTGILPDLFKEGQGIVAQGRLDANGQFVAQEVLAKHDENYMPPEVSKALEDAKGQGS